MGSEIPLHLATELQEWWRLFGDRHTSRFHMELARWNLHGGAPDQKPPLVSGTRVGNDAMSSLDPTHLKSGQITNSNHVVTKFEHRFPIDVTSVIISGARRTVVNGAELRPPWP
jgi:hypothetical protein